jgi:hypothetical protein
MRSRYFHPERGYLALASVFLRRVGIVFVGMAIGATAGVCVVLSLIAVNGADSTLSSRQTLITLAPVVRAPPPLANSLPAGEDGVLQAGRADPSGSQKSSEPAALVIGQTPPHIEATAVIKRPLMKKRVTKERRVRNRSRADRIRQRLELAERLRPQ